MRIPILFCLSFLAAPLAAQSGPVPAPADATATLLASADAHYANRASNAQGARANPAEIDAAINDYRALLKQSPDAIPVRWRLQLALFFRAVYCGETSERRKKILGDARAIGDVAVANLEAPLKGKPAAARLAALRAIPEAAALYLWDAVVWGEWALAYGKMAAARQGAAAKIRDLSQTVIDLDPALEEGAGYRVLGRLHHQSPSIPFITGWVNHKLAVPLLRKALAIGPINRVNRFFLADALLDGDAAARREAATILHACATDTPRPALQVEDSEYAARCRTRLADL